MTAPDAPLDRLLEHRAWVRGLVRSIVLDEARADDVEQQVWLTALRHGGRVETPRAWLAAVARNWARKLHRGESRSARRDAEAARPEAREAGADPVERAEAHREVVDAVLSLPEPLRLAVLHHYFDGLSIADVAKRLDVPHETVRSRLRLARARLRARLGPTDAVAAWSPALLVLGGLPRDLGAAAGASSLTGGAIAMTAAQKLAFALVVPAAVGAAWITSRAAAPEPSEDRGAEIARLQERLDRIEKSVAASPRPAPSDDRALGRRLEAIEARIEDVAKNAAASTAPAGGAAPKGESTAAAMAAKAATDAGKKKDDAKAELAGLLAALKAKPGSPEHLAALKELAEWIVRRAGPPADEEAVAMAEGILEAEARNGRITPTEAAELLPSLERLPQDNAARPGLACVVAGGWAKDERLGGLLDRFAANTEMRVHRRLLSLLDHFPSAAFGDYVIRLVRDERDASILQSALDVDRVDAGANAENAVRFMQAVEGRIADGSLDAKMRRRAGAAITMAGMRSQDAGAELLRRLAERESDQAVAAAYRDGAESLGKRTPLSPKAVEKIFD